MLSGSIAQIHGHRGAMAWCRRGCNWRLWRGFPDVRSDLAAEIIARLGEAIVSLDLERVVSVTATLLRNLEWIFDVRDLIRSRKTAESVQLSVIRRRGTGDIVCWSGKHSVAAPSDRLANLSPMTHIF